MSLNNPETSPQKPNMGFELGIVKSIGRLLINYAQIAQAEIETGDYLLSKIEADVKADQNAAAKLFYDDHNENPKFFSYTKSLGSQEAIWQKVTSGGVRTSILDVFQNHDLLEIRMLNGDGPKAPKGLTATNGIALQVINKNWPVMQTLSGIDPNNPKIITQTALEPTNPDALIRVGEFKKVLMKQIDFFEVGPRRPRS